MVEARLSFVDLPQREQDFRVNRAHPRVVGVRFLDFFDGGQRLSRLVVRLQAIEQRLDSMLQAVQAVEPALDKFYGSLSDEQKERFNRLIPHRA